MIHNIHPHVFDNTFLIAGNIEPDDYVFHFTDRSLLLKNNGERLEIPRKKDLSQCDEDGMFLFTLNGVRCFLVCNCEPLNSAAFAYHDIKFPYTVTEKEIDWTSGVALHIKNWYTQHKFCGKCGGLNQPKKDERAVVCSNCQSVLYPTISPAIIVAILCNDKILLARNTNFPDGFFSLVAGYVDVGESIEEAVTREVKEEVGIEIKNIRYYKSQPWPFSGSMMLGFIAEAKENQKIKVDEKEIVEAGWYSRNNLPNHPPNRSIAGEIIEKFKNGEPL